MKSMKRALAFEIVVQDPDPEADDMSIILSDTMILRLLRPLESDGRAVKSSLVHGDAWCANTCCDSETRNPLIFDACCFKLVMNV